MFVVGGDLAFFTDKSSLVSACQPVKISNLSWTKEPFAVLNVVFCSDLLLEMVLS